MDVGVIIAAVFFILGWLVHTVLEFLSHLFRRLLPALKRIGRPGRRHVVQTLSSVRAGH